MWSYSIHFGIRVIFKFAEKNSTRVRIMLNICHHSNTLVMMIYLRALLCHSESIILKKKRSEMLQVVHISIVEPVASSLID